MQTALSISSLSRDFSTLKASIYTMDGYDIEPTPFYLSADRTVRLFHATSLQRHLPVVIKRHDVYFVTKPAFLSDLNSAINAGLAQARAEHPHSCKILEVNVDLDPGQNIYSVLHVLEALDKDLGRVIEFRQRERTGVNEAEIRTFLMEIGSAVAFAHGKGIAHRDIKPQNVFLDREGHYKLGDFGCYYERKGTSRTEHFAGTLPYMSPQQRGIIAGREDKYDVFRNDIYALGMTALSLATLNMPVSPLNDEKIAALVESIRCSQELKGLLVAMTASKEENRPRMDEILLNLGYSGNIPPKYAVLPEFPTYVPPTPYPEESKSQKAAEPSQLLAYIEAQELQLYEVSTNCWHSAPLSSATAVDEGSMYVWTAKDLLCSGGSPYTGLGSSEKGSKCAYSLACSENWSISRLPDMQVPRYFHGLYWFPPHNSVLVFSGKRHTGRSNPYSRQKPPFHHLLRP